MGLVYNSDLEEKSLTYGDIDYAVQAKNGLQGQNFSLQYPSNLDNSPEYGGHRVMFFINVSGNGQIATTESGYNGSIDARYQTEDLPENEYYKVSGEAIKSLLRELPKVDDITTLKPMRRLKAAISLYVPNTLQQSYNVSWSDEDMTLGNFIESAASSVQQTGQEMISSVQSLVGSAIGRTMLSKSDYAQKALRTTPANAKNEQLFKGVDFRTFSFDYEFAPKSEQEAESVLDIIRLFRHHMLPEYADEANFMFVYPQDFDIKYFIKERENDFLEKQMTAVLTSCLINYTPDGQFNTFSNGMPTKIRMQLTFKELGLATKNTSPFDRSGI